MELIRADVGKRDIYRYSLSWTRLQIYTRGETPRYHVPIMNEGVTFCFPKVATRSYSQVPHRKRCNYLVPRYPTFSSRYDGGVEVIIIIIIIVRVSAYRWELVSMF